MRVGKSNLNLNWLIDLNNDSKLFRRNSTTQSFITSKPAKMIVKRTAVMKSLTMRGTMLKIVRRSLSKNKLSNNT